MSKNRVWVVGRTPDECLLINEVRIVEEYTGETNLKKGIVEIIPIKLSQKKTILLYCSQVFKGRDLFQDSSF